MPLPDVASVVAGRSQGLGEGSGAVVQPQIIEEQTVRKRILPGEQAAPVWAADGNPRDRIREVDTLICKGIDIRCADIRIAHVAMVHCAPLIGEEVENVGTLSGRLRGCLAGRGEGSGRAGEEVTTVHRASPKNPPGEVPCKEDRSSGTDCDPVRQDPWLAAATGTCPGRYRGAALFFLTVPLDQLDFALELADLRAGGVDFTVNRLGFVSP